MRLSSRSFPYPVIGNRDDVPGSAFQATLEMSADSGSVYLDCSIACSSPTINELVRSGDVKYLMHVECGNTMFRRTFEFDIPVNRITLSADDLHDNIDVNVFACAAKNLPGYRIAEAHSDYGGTSFQVRRGDILAIADGHTYFLETSFDVLKNVASIMQIQESTESGDRMMQADFNSDRIVVILSQPDFLGYKQLRQNNDMGPVLTAAIVIPVLMEALNQLTAEDDAEQRWKRQLRARLASLGVDLTKVELMDAAQRLLSLPIKRALSSALRLADVES